jgi:ATP-dependent exoDNAse (exonuclease V) beta subunit
VTDRTAPARHLSVTQLADLGSGKYDSRHYRRFRRSVLHDAPEVIEPATYDRRNPKLIGEIVHEALRWWRFPGEIENLEKLLDSYAWERGILDNRLREQAVIEAGILLNSFKNNPVYRWVSGARHLYREMPFVYKTGTRIIHGVIDTLLEREDGTWVIVDYKTAFVPRGVELTEHARRYHLQVGAYAEAVREQLRQMRTVDAVPLRVYIHYIRYSHTVEVHQHEWQAALANLETLVDLSLG